MAPTFLCGVGIETSVRWFPSPTHPEKNRFFGLRSALPAPKLLTTLLHSSERSDFLRSRSIVCCLRNLPLNILASILGRRACQGHVACASLSPFQPSSTSDKACGTGLFLTLNAFLFIGFLSLILSSLPIIGFSFLYLFRACISKEDLFSPSHIKLGFIQNQRKKPTHSHTLSASRTSNALTQRLE